MRAGRRSRTAEATALLRAAHRILDDRPLVLDDPWAARLLPRHLGLWLRPIPSLSRRLERRLAARLAGTGRRWRLPLGSRRIRAQVLVRSRYSEDCLDRALECGAEQSVLLAAGLDSFALRRPDLEGHLRLFEVDHPDTQRWKRERLRRLGSKPPAWLSFSPCDFERQSIEEALASSGYDPTLPTLFSWLGASYYLTPDAIRDTFRFVASQAPGTSLVLDYWSDRGLLGARDRALLESIRLSVRGQGEPMLSFFSPEQLRDEAERHGLVVTDQLSPEDAQSRYLAGRRDGLQMPEFARLAKVEVP